MIKKVFLLFTLFYAKTLFSQDFELGKVTLEELRETVHPLDSSAPAAVLYKRGRTYFEVYGVRWVIVTEVEVRIKIYNSKGHGYAHVSVPFHVYEKIAEDVKFSDAVTYNLSGGRIVKTKPEKDKQFDEYVGNDNWEKKITLPDVTDGSVIEYKYTVVSPNISVMPEWSFQDLIPINNMEYSVSIPREYVYDREYKCDFEVIEDTSQENRKLELEFRNKKIEENKTTYRAKNIKGANSEAYVKYILADSPDIASTEKIQLSQWETRFERLNKHTKFGGQLKKMSYFERDLKSMVSNIPNYDKRMEAVFNYVKKRMTWNEWGGLICENEIEIAYANQTGNAAEINLMLVAMLRYAGLTANPIAVKAGYDAGNSLGNESYNYIIACAETSKGLVLLDATSKYSLVNVIPFRVFGEKGRMLKSGLPSTEVDLVPKFNSLKSNFVIAKIEEDGIISGHIKEKYFDYNTYVFRRDNDGIDKAQHKMEGYIGEKEILQGNIEITDFSIANMDKYDLPVEESYAFKGGNFIEVVANKIYISPMLMYRVDEKPFTAAEEINDINFVFPYQDKSMLTISIPEGYVLESFPEPLSLVTRDDMLTFKFSIQVNQANQIQIIVVNTVNKAVVPAGHYQTLKEFYAAIVKKQAEKIVLVKKS